MKKNIIDVLICCLIIVFCFSCTSLQQDVMVSSVASENIEEDGNIYRQIVLGNVIVTEANKDKAIKTGNLDVLTIYPQAVASEHTSELNILEQVTMQYDKDKYEFFFNSPAEAIIHGMPLEDPSLIATHIGSSLAAEGTKKYYCFRRDKTTNKTDLVFLTFNKSTNRSP